MSIAHLNQTRYHNRQGFEEWAVGQTHAFHYKTQSITFLGTATWFGDSENPIQVESRLFPSKPLLSLSSDKNLYRAGDDVVRVFIYQPNAVNYQTVLRILCNGATISKPTVKLDSNGMGIYEMHNPVAGEYTIALHHRSLKFTVASYQLAPLTATLKNIQISTNNNQETIECELVTESYGAALNDHVKIDLINLGNHPPTIIQTVTNQAQAGILQASLTLNGKGPFALNLQAKSDANKTATVPLPGSQQQQRAALTLSDWSSRYITRNMPFAGAQEIRGSYVGQEASQSTSPFSILVIEENQVQLQVTEPLLNWHIAIIDPNTQHIQEFSGNNASSTDIIRLPLQGDWNMLLAGAWRGSTCWEGQAAIIRPDNRKITINCPQTTQPNSTLPISLSGPANASAFVVVKDSRLQSLPTATSSLAASRKLQIESLQALSAGPAPQLLDYIFAPMVCYSAPPMAESSFPPPRARGTGAYSVRPSMTALKDFSGAPGKTKSKTPSLKLQQVTESPRRDRPEVIYAKLIQLDDQGKANIDIQLGGTMGTMNVEVFAAFAGMTAAAQQQFSVSKELFGELVLPPFVAAGDHAEGKLYVRLHQGTAQARIYQDGELRQEYTVSVPGQTFTFPVTAGHWEAVIQGNIRDQSSFRIQEPGKLIWRQQAIRLLAPQEQINLQDIEHGLSLRVLPSIDANFQRLIGSLYSYEHCCCEQTSSVMLAAMTVYLGAENAKKQAAEEHIIACGKRMESMFLPNDGFKSYPNSQAKRSYYSQGATWNLLALTAETMETASSELRDCFQKMHSMAQNAAKAHKIVFAPETPKNAREAYHRWQKFPADRDKIANYIVSKLQASGPTHLTLCNIEQSFGYAARSGPPPSTATRAENAFGAAILLSMTGVYLQKGMKLANQVLSASQQNGGFYSTLDSVAALSLLKALQTNQMIGANRTCLVNGQSYKPLEAAEITDCQSITAMTTPLQVEVTRLVHEDYNALQSDLRAHVYLQQHKDKISRPVRVGSAIDLVIELEAYEEGDLVHVFLPAALSWVHGGGQVKKFSLDFQGKQKLIIPLAATGRTLGPDNQLSTQHFSVCIRNMYDEDRGTGFPSLGIQVHDQEPDDGIVDWVKKGIQSLTDLLS